MARAAINREVCRWARGGVNRVRMAVEVTPYRNILKKSSFRTNTFQSLMSGKGFSRRESTGIKISSKRNMYGRGVEKEIWL